MIRKDLTVGLPDGLEARPVAVFVQIASKYSSMVTIEYKGRKVNAKSIMGMMSLGIARGESISILTDGNDEEEAMEGIMDYLSGELKDSALAY